MNIVSQLVGFFALTVFTHLLPWRVLGLLLLVLLLALSQAQSHHFYALGKRLKWFYLTMMIIFAFNTPGEYLRSWPMSIAPTYEGLQAGMTQVVRILVVLAALSLLLALNTRERLLSGIYVLLKPFAKIGLAPERFSARLWLTLHYVESWNEPLKIQHLGTRIAAIFDESEHPQALITLEQPVFRYADIVLILLMLIMFVLVLLKVHL